MKRTRTSSVIASAVLLAACSSTLLFACASILLVACGSILLVACGSTPRSEATGEREAQTESAAHSSDTHSSDTHSSDTTASPADVSADHDERYADAPEGTAAIAGLLMARHTEDLPRPETLRAHPEAEAALSWLADHADRLVLRVRALASLRFFSSPAVRSTLLGVLTDEGAHPTLRAAAARGSEGVALDEELRAALEAARASGDRRVARAVDERLERGSIDGHGTVAE